MNKKILFSLISIVLFLLFISAISIIRLVEASRFETQLFNCRDFPGECGQVINHSQESEIAEAIFGYLTAEVGYTDIRPANFQATTSVSMTPPYILGSGLSGGNPRKGYYPLICPQNFCYQDYDSVILVDLQPIVHFWIVERNGLELSTKGMTITGQETQELIVVAGVSETTGIAEHPELVETARNNEDNVLWQKQVNYEIVCTLGGCNKNYQ